MRTSARYTAVLAVLAAAGLLLGAGCGSDGDGATVDRELAGTTTVRLRIEGMT